MLHLDADQAMLVAIGVGLVGYFDVLFGGYMAVFRTDVLQFFFVLLMAFAFAAYAIWNGAIDLHGLSPRKGYWLPPWVTTAGTEGPLTYMYHAVIGTVMGFSFLAAAPDAWKRVFIVTKLREASFARFVIFVCVGLMPFVVVTPIALTMPPIPNGPLNTGLFYATIPVTDFMTVIAATGLTACFLSSFDSAVLSSVHVGLIIRRTSEGNPMSRDRAVPLAHGDSAAFAVPHFPSA